MFDFSRLFAGILCLSAEKTHCGYTISASGPIFDPGANEAHSGHKFHESEQSETRINNYPSPPVGTLRRSLIIARLYICDLRPMVRKCGENTIGVQVADFTQENWFDLAFNSSPVLGSVG
jgi:hypothetical protein